MGTSHSYRYVSVGVTIPGQILNVGTINLNTVDKYETSTFNLSSYRIQGYNFAQSSFGIPAKIRTSCDMGSVTYSISYSYTENTAILTVSYIGSKRGTHAPTVSIPIYVAYTT